MSRLAEFMYEYIVMFVCLYFRNPMRKRVNVTPSPNNTSKNGDKISALPEGWARKNGGGEGEDVVGSGDSRRIRLGKVMNSNMHLLSRQIDFFTLNILVACLNIPCENLFYFQILSGKSPLPLHRHGRLLHLSYYIVMFTVLLYMFY